MKTTQWTSSDPVQGYPALQEDHEAASEREVPATELVGRVKAAEILEAPLTGRPCVHYKVGLTLWQRLMEGPGAGAVHEEAGIRFMLCCRLGDVLVDCASARVRLLGGSARRVRPGSDPDLDRRLGALYRRLSRVRRSGSTACHEQRLEPGDRIWLFGHLRAVPHRDGTPAGYRVPPQRLLLQASELRVLELAW